MNRDRSDRWSAAALRAACGLPTLLAALLVSAPVFAQECEPGRNILETLSAEERAVLDAEAAAVPNGEGRLFRIERDGTAPSHLFGTMHLTDPRVVALPHAAETAFGAASSVVVETLDIADEATMAAAVLARSDLTLLPAGTNLIDLVPEERRVEVSEVLAANAMPAEAVRTLQPWFVTVALVMPPCEAARHAEGVEVLDLALLQRAQADGKSVAGLESAVEQLEALASLPLEMQGENLAATIDLLPQLPDVFETMTALYLDGRIAAIAPAIERFAGEEDESAAETYTAFEEAVVLRRNRTMGERLGPILAEGGAFVAVGALHLPGEEGLVEILRREGWQVTRAD